MNTRLDPVRVLVLRRGMDDAYYSFMQIYADTNGIELVIDRRVTERRRAGESPAVERRASDRRQKPPASWQADGFIAVARET